MIQAMGTPRHEKLQARLRSFLDAGGHGSITRIAAEGGVSAPTIRKLRDTGACDDGIALRIAAALDALEGEGARPAGESVAAPPATALLVADLRQLADLIESADRSDDYARRRALAGLRAIAESASTIEAIVEARFRGSTPRSGS